MSTYPAVGSRAVKKALRRAGWVPRQGKGHTIFSKEGRTIPVDDDQERFSAGLLAAMRKQSGLSRSEFIEMLKGKG